MDNTMEIDTARSPEPHHLSPITDSGSIPTLDGWIESLMTCKQLAEDDVRRLCDRVGFPCSWEGILWYQRGPGVCRVGYRVLIVPWVYRQERYCKKSQTFSQWYVAPCFYPFHQYEWLY